MSNLLAQRQVYDSLYSIREGVTGRAVFEYKGSGGANISREGPFKFDYENYRYRMKILYYSSEEWRGEYKHDKKEGRWNYDCYENAVFLQGMEQRELRYQLDSKNSSLKARYTEGIPSGDWEYMELFVDQDSNEIVLQDFQVSFKNGMLHGDVFCTMSDGHMTAVINGQADKGRFDGLWTFKYDDYFEIRKYDRGVLLSLTELSKEADTIKALVFPLSKELERLMEDSSLEMNASGRTTFRDGYPSSSPFVRSQLLGNNYLSLMIDLLLKNDEEELDQTFYPLGSYRHLYPFSQSEKVMLTELDSVLTLYHTKLKMIKNEEVIDLAYSDDYLTKLVKEWLEYEVKLFEYIERAAGKNVVLRLEKTYREGLVTDTMKSLLSSARIEVNKETVVFNYAQESKQEPNLIAYLLSNYTDRCAVADSLHSEFRTKMKSMHLDKALLLRNQKIIELIEQLDSNIEVNVNDPLLNFLITSVHDEYLGQIVGKEYQQFLEEADDRKHQTELGDSILMELHNIEEIYHLIGKITNRRREIDELYTEYVFDPFTFTDRVPSRLKRKLYELISIEMFNQLVEQATVSNEPIKCLNTLDALYDVQGAMFVLKDRDTKKLESRLKRHKTLDERLIILSESLD